MDTEIDHNLEQITREYVDFLDDTVRDSMNQVCMLSSMLSRICNCQLQCITIYILIYM